jgi:hypothetical protein
VGYIKIQNPFTLQSIKSIERRQVVLTAANLIRPATLEFSKQYLRLERPEIKGNPIPNPVKFIAFDPCPACIIVQDLDGIKFRCPRNEIYLYTEQD